MISHFQLLIQNSLIGDQSAPTPTFASLCTTTRQNPRAPRGFCGRTDGQFSPHPIRPFPFSCPKFRCQIRPHSRTAASRPPRWASAVRAWGISLGSFPLCVLSDLCGVPLRATTIRAFPENTAEIGRNAERERADARAPRTQNGRCQSFPSAHAAPRAPRWLRPRRSVLIVSRWSSRHWRLRKYGLAITLFLIRGLPGNSRNVSPARASSDYPPPVAGPLFGLLWCFP